MNIKTIIAILVGGMLVTGHAEAEPAKFDKEKDLISLHYDHAPDKDDGHSAAADLTILATLYDKEWIKKHVVAVSGAYGINKKTFNDKSDKVMDATWNDYGGWLDAHEKYNEVVNELMNRWLDVLKNGGDIWVKEGGQSDITAELLMIISRMKMADLNVDQRVHVVQHSDWNENKTNPHDLAYTKRMSDYIRIKDANAYLNVKGGDEAFEKAAIAHPVFGASWKAAFEYYPNKQRLDFSDTGECVDD